MLIGNLLALLQNNIKRLLAYSSIANFGYILVAFITGGQMGMQACTFYITAYIATILGAFGVITIISDTDAEAVDIINYKGLFRRKPFLASALTIFLLSLAGIPLTAGFMGKYFLLTAGLGNSQWILAFVLIISSVIGLFYYLRVIAMMMQQEESNTAISTLRTSTIGSMYIAILLFVVIALGLCPEWLIETIRRLAI
jgi:NADH-quinone oxidoreductase subunit N